MQANDRERRLRELAAKLLFSFERRASHCTEMSMYRSRFGTTTSPSTT
jgi:hypothetical protein